MKLCLRPLRNVSFLFQVVKYFGLAIGMEVFWPSKDLSLYDVMTTTGLQQCFVTINGCNNLGKKQVSCCVEDLLEVLLKNVEEVEKLGDMQNGFCDREINLEVSYTLDKCAKCFNGESGSNSVNEEGSEDKIVTRYDDKENKEILKENWEQEEQANKQ